MADRDPHKPSWHRTRKLHIVTFNHTSVSKPKPVLRVFSNCCDHTVLTLRELDASDVEFEFSISDLLIDLLRTMIFYTPSLGVLTSDMFIDTPKIFTPTRLLHSLHCC